MIERYIARAGVPNFFSSGLFHIFASNMMSDSKLFSKRFTLGP